MFLQRNVASQVFTLPGTLRAVADGSAATSGATLTWVKDGTAAASAGTLAHVSDGAYTYAPTQGETDAKICGWVLSKAGAAGLAGSVRTTNADPNDGTRLGQTALPNAAANANGGLPVLSSSGTTLAYTVSTLTTYTGNTPQTGDSFARIGLAGAGLTALGDARVANLDAAVSSRGTSTLTQAQVTGGAYSVQSASCVLGDGRVANLDAAVSSRGTSTLTQTQVTGGAYSVQSASCVLGDARLADLDAAVSSRSTYAGGDTSGTTTLLGRLTTTRAANLDNLDAAVTSRLAASSYAAPPSAAAVATAVWTDLLAGSDFSTAASIGKLIKDDLDAAVSTRSTYAGADTAGTTTLLARLTAPRAGNLDNLDAAISTRSTLAAAGVWDLATSGHNTAGTFGAALLAASAPPAATVAAAVWDLATSGHTTSGTFGAAMSAAGSAGDPWSAALPGAYGAGTAGHLIGGGLAAVDGYSPHELLTLFAAVLLGKSSGGGAVFRDLADTKDRVSATLDARGNRTAVVIDPT